MQQWSLRRCAGPTPLAHTHTLAKKRVNSHEKSEVNRFMIDVIHLRSPCEPLSQSWASFKKPFAFGSGSGWELTHIFLCVCARNCIFTFWSFRRWFSSIYIIPHLVDHRITLEWHLWVTNVLTCACPILPLPPRTVAGLVQPNILAICLPATRIEMNKWLEKCLNFVHFHFDGRHWWNENGRHTFFAGEKNWAKYLWDEKFEFNVSKLKIEFAGWRTPNVLRRNRFYFTASNAMSLWRWKWLLRFTIGLTRLDAAKRPLCAFHHFPVFVFHFIFPYQLRRCVRSVRLIRTTPLDASTRKIGLHCTSKCLSVCMGHPYSIMKMDIRQKCRSPPRPIIITVHFVQRNTFCNLFLNRKNAFTIECTSLHAIAHTHSAHTHTHAQHAHSVDNHFACISISVFRMKSSKTTVSVSSESQYSLAFLCECAAEAVVCSVFESHAVEVKCLGPRQCHQLFLFLSQTIKKPIQSSHKMKYLARIRTYEKCAHPSSVRPSIRGTNN